MKCKEYDRKEREKGNVWDLNPYTTRTLRFLDFPVRFAAVLIFYAPPSQSDSESGKSKNLGFLAGFGDNVPIVFTHKEELLVELEKVSLKKRLVTLFFSMLSISAFTFGGGFVIVTLMKRRFVDDLKWLKEDDMLDMTAIAQSCPGAIAVNGAILVGRRVAGAAGIAVATLATVIPPLVILSLVSYFYALFADNPYVAAVLAGMQAGVAAVIVDVVLNLGAGVLKEKRMLLNIIMVAAFAAALMGVNVVYIILASGVVGIVCALTGKGKKHAA